MFQVTPSDLSLMELYAYLCVWVCSYSAVKPDIPIIVGMLFLAMLMLYDEE